MEILFTISLVVLGLYISIQLISIFSLLYFENDKPKKPLIDDELPSISILIAARNEEKNITRCLTSLQRLNYPLSKLQILIGNDSSEDDTQKNTEDFIIDKPQFALVNITETLGKARGKANVLAQLAHKATGEIYLITDADISVNAGWAREIVAYYSNNKMGIVSGVTIVEDYGTMGRMQEIDWMYFMGLLKSFYNLGLNCTAVGNNMAIHKKAYWDIGGYENIDFSITEDYKLYKEVRKKGWQTQNILNPKVINKSTATKNFYQLMHQRKRWLVGARELPFYWWILFAVFGSFTPFIIIVFLVNIKLALMLYFIKLILQSISIYILQNKMDVRKNIDYLITYEVYNTVVAVCTLCFYLFPIQLQWKNRKYAV
jgi:cellulose synthase/poly-beta-1,6-N-acetylglucosamine synthase-like glycosyltransferase